MGRAHAADIEKVEAENRELQAKIKTLQSRSVEFYGKIFDNQPNSY